jgi:hypothetical protein
MQVDCDTTPNKMFRRGSLLLAGAVLMVMGLSAHAAVSKIAPRLPVTRITTANAGR